MEDERERLSSSPLFSAEWYCRRNPDAVDDPVAHYIAAGGASVGDPHPLFATEWYLQRYPDSRSWRTPLHHFLDVGRNGTVDPHPLFDSDWYAARYQDLCPGEVPAEQFLRSLEPRDTHPLFSCERYLAGTYADTDNGVQPVVHFLTGGARRGWSPSAMVDLGDIHRRVRPTGTRDPLTYVLSKLSLDEAYSLPLPFSQALSAQRELPSTEAEWKWEYVVEEQWRWADTFVLYRILGNDLPPRHERGQSIRNLRFILENEPELPRCEKRWILNRIVDREGEGELIRLLEEHGQPYLRIPFDEDVYQTIGWRLDDFESPGVTYGRFPVGGVRARRSVAHDHVYHDKNLYVMNNNGARNAALRDGRSRATWVLPWDGNCFLTLDGWAEIVERVFAAKHLRYFFVPMARMHDNAVLLNGGLRPVAEEEPQCIFRRDALEEFDENARYGRRPKVELFYRLGYPGSWDDWHFYAWEAARPDPGPDAGRWEDAGWVARLFSGNGVLETENRERALSRSDGIRVFLDGLDEAKSRRQFDARQLMVVCEESVAAQRAALRQRDPGMRRLALELKTAADKAVVTGFASSGALDRWQEPDERALREVSMLALAWLLLEDDSYAEAGAVIASKQVWQPLWDAVAALAADEPEAAAALQVQQELPHYLDAVRLLERSGAYEGADELRELLNQHQAHLRVSPSQMTGYSSSGLPGTLYDVHDVALSAFLDDVVGANTGLRRAEDRLRDQFTPDGRQPHESSREDALHGHTLNLQAYTTLATMGRRLGSDLWGPAGSQHPGLRPAASWLLRHASRPWPLRESGCFDHDRLQVLAHSVRAVSPAYQPGDWLAPAARVRTRFPPGLGIRPFWQVGLPGVQDASNDDEGQQL